jgi:hypothetical protein
LTESVLFEEIKPPFEAGPLSHDAMQLTIKGKIKPKISDRVLIPAMIFGIGIFDLKII